MDKKQDIETEEILSDTALESKTTPRLRAEKVGVILASDGMGRHFGKLSRKTNEEKLSFGLI